MFYLLLFCFYIKTEQVIFDDQKVEHIIDLKSKVGILVKSTAFLTYHTRLVSLNDRFYRFRLATLMVPCTVFPNERVTLMHVPNRRGAGAPTTTIVLKHDPSLC